MSFQVVYIETTRDDLIVLNPRWLCGEVLGKLLNGRGNLPYDGRISVTHLNDLFPDMDVTDAALLLTALELCSVVTAGSAYQLSCYNSLPVPSEDRKWNSYPRVGGVALVADATARLRFIFPRMQHTIWNSTFLERLSEWSGGISFRRSSDSSSENVITIQINTEDNEDLIHVIGCGHDPHTLLHLQQVATAIVLRAVDTCCPGVYLQLRALSPRDIRDGVRSLPRTYSTRDVAVAQIEEKDEIQIDDEEAKESLKDVLAYGDEELYTTLRPGVDLHVSELPMYIRCRLAALLDPPHPHGRDWLLLAFGLGLGDAIPQVDSPDVAAVSRTVCLLALWSRNHDATIRRLLDVVRRTLERPDVEELLLQLVPLCLSSTTDHEQSACPSPGPDSSFQLGGSTGNLSHRNSRKSSTTSC